MVFVRDQVHSALESALEGVCKVYHAYPAKDATLPAVSFYEAGNNEYASTIEGEYITEISYVIDVYAASVTETDEISEKINDAMAGFGFERTFSYDVPDPNVRHKTMRYRGLIDPRYFVSKT
jgi:hypothetical protein